MPPVTTRFPANRFGCRRGSDRHLHQGRCHRSAAPGFFSASALLSGTTPAASTTQTRRRPRTWTTVRPPSPTGRIRPLRVHRLQCDLVPRPASPPAPGALGYPPASPGEVDEQIPLPQRLVAAGRHSRAFFRYRYAPTVLAGASHLAQICHGVVPAAHQPLGLKSGLPPPRPPWTFAGCFDTVSCGERRHPSDGRSDDEVLGTCEAAVAGVLSDASRGPQRLIPRPHTVCSSRGRLR